MSKAFFFGSMPTGNLFTTSMGSRQRMRGRKHHSMGMNASGVTTSFGRINIASNPLFMGGSTSAINPSQIFRTPVNLHVVDDFEDEWDKLQFDPKTMDPKYYEDDEVVPPDLSDYSKVNL